MFKMQLPGSMSISHTTNGPCFHGTAIEILRFAKELRQLASLPPGGFLLVQDLEFVVANHPSRMPKRFAFPAQAWNIMASKFAEVANGQEEPLFFFSHCGYMQVENGADIGVKLLPQSDR